MSVIVRLEYEIRVKGGEVLESSEERGPLELVLGRRRLLPALEEIIARLKPGEEVSGELEAARAFGDESVLPTMELPRSELGDEEPEPGRKYEARSAQTGEPVCFRVISSGGGRVTVRLLHPLADRDLAFRLKLLTAEDASRPPPLPARAIGIDSTAIELLEEPAEA